MKKNERKNKLLSKVLFVIVTIILILMLVVNFSIMFQAKKDKDKVPSIFGIKPFMVLSGSMETNIKIGDLIFTKEIDPSTLKVNDVIAFRDEENTVTTHRIIDIIMQDGVNYFVTKGDNNNSQDKNLVEYKDVEGIYIGRIPALGKIMKSLSEPIVVIIAILGITLIFIIGFVISNKRKLDNERKEFLEYKKMKEQEENSKNDN